MKILLTALNAKFIHSNLALRYLKKYCSDISEHIELCEFTINNEKSFILKEIFEKKPDVVGFSCYIWNINMILDIAENLKKVLPECLIFLGGPEVSFESEEFLKSHSFIDLVIRGEGEKTFFDLSHAILENSPFNNIKGITYRKDNEIFINPPQDDLNPAEIPFTYESFDDVQNRIIYYESQRGCPYNCQFCLSSIDGKVRFLPEERVINDLNYFINNKVKQVKFVDRSFNCNKKHCHTIWKHIMDNDNGVTNFHMEVEAHTLTDEEISFLSAARKGLFQFEIGVQSTNENTLKAVCRNPDFETLKKKILKIKEAGNIHIHLDLIAGLPYEGYESFKKSFNDVYSLRPEQLQLGFLKLLKGSGLRRDAEKYGIIYNSKAPYEVLFTKDMDFEHMLKLKNIEEMVETYYNSYKISNAEKYISSLFDSPFDFYESLALYWQNNGHHRINHNKSDLYEIFYNFCQNDSHTNKHLGVIENLLRYDMLLSDNLKTLPSFSSSDDTEEYKARKRLFFNTEENIKNNLPALLSYTPAQLSRMCRIEHFDYDILSFSNNNCLKQISTDILFNYYNRDIITNRAETISIQL